MTARDRKALLTGAALIAGAIFALRVAPWSIRSVANLRASARERAEALARVREIAAAAPAVRDSLTVALQRVVALAPKFVDGRTAAEAQAALGGLVSLIAARHRLRVIRLDPLPDSTVAVFGRVALRGELEGDVTGMTGFVKAIETGDPLLTIPSLSVQPTDPGGRGPEVLRIEARVAGFYLPKRTR